MGITKDCAFAGFGFIDCEKHVAKARENETTAIVAMIKTLNRR